MPNDTHEPPTEAVVIAPKSAPLRWLWKFNHGLDVVKGLSLVTVLSSLVVGYFQYLNAYQEKVGSQAKEDMASATATFTEISRSFSEMQALQQTLYSDFSRAVRDKSDGSDKALGTRNARVTSERYEKARLALSENIDLLTRKAEVHIDWASDTYRDAADKHNVDDDPLSRRVLRDYAFDCSDKFNFPAFETFMPRTTIRRSGKSPTTGIARSPKSEVLTIRPSRKMRSSGSAPVPTTGRPSESTGTAPNTTC